MISYDSRCMNCATPGIVDLCHSCRDELKFWPMLVLTKDGEQLQIEYQEELIPLAASGDIFKMFYFDRLTEHPPKWKECQAHVKILIEDLE